MNRRRLVGLLLLAATSAGSLASHRHTDLEGPEKEAGAVRVLTTHNPQSRASHWHAVVRLLEDEPCWACHRSRHSALPTTTAASLPILSVRTLATLPPRSTACVSRFTRLSRGPPALP